MQCHDSNLKICGLCRAQDAQAAREAGATHLGLILVPGTPRAVTVEEASVISAPLPAFGQPLTKGEGSISWVGVFQNPTMEELAEAVKSLPLSMLQLHGQEFPEFCQEVMERFGLPVIKALSVHTPETLLDQVQAYQGHVTLVLLDRPKGMHNLDWLPAIVKHLKSLNGLPLPFWLAGGLTPDNLPGVLQQLDGLPGFAGVDLASGVERDGQPREKDPAKLKALANVKLTV